jgi:hypothetical protein
MASPRTSKPSAIQMERIITTLRADNTRMRGTIAALQAPPEPYIAIKSVDHHGYHKSTLLRWAERGLIDAKQEGSRWFCRQSSVNSRIKRLSGG